MGKEIQVFDDYGGNFSCFLNSSQSDTSIE